MIRNRSANNASANHDHTQAFCSRLMLFHGCPPLPLLVSHLSPLCHAYTIRRFAVQYTLVCRGPLPGCAVAKRYQNRQVRCFRESIASYGRQF